MDSLKELESFKYYWFNFQDKIYLIHFENNPNFNRVPFLFLLLVPEAKPEIWLKSRYDNTVLNAFDNLQINSFFISFLPNQQNMNCYNIPIAIDHIDMDLEVVSRNGTIFIKSEV